MGPGPGTHRPGWLRRGSPLGGRGPRAGPGGDRRASPAGRPGRPTARRGKSPPRSKRGAGGPEGSYTGPTKRHKRRPRVLPPQVNVYVLGKTFLLLARELCINAPAIGTAGPVGAPWARGRAGACPANPPGARRVATPGLEPERGGQSQGGVDGVQTGHRQCCCAWGPACPPLVDSSWQPGRLTACRATPPVPIVSFPTAELRAWERERGED